jgi:hypothetical protein
MCARTSEGGTVAKGAGEKGTYGSKGHRKQPTEFFTHKEILLGFASIKGGCPEQGINWKGPVVAGPEGPAFVPSSEGFGTSDSGAMST